ncbi:prepilin-type N-terminal cleavage/methylation domain-containing protein [Polynucleobacter sp. VK25]|uniref:prepilin-type N-terminal cleavage/methylation domain-containing protein n=1 Tax=Polynucleobacter sp. VK25 TaxID=1758398 RepID=UPI001BFD5573|nr:prepilin-type N-terminal cleavage/methylation domain-containing protein [Polynucleobacter sp. VK25]QWD68654.1 prepilin-type N-terminal cleavage/methylation domain-containing protein [Polynucleobacter sp. VK25]
MMPISVAGSKSFLASTRKKVVTLLHSQGKSAESGFTLIELLVAIAIMAVILAVAVLAIPNHEDRYWRDNLDQLVSSLNLAQEESAMSGTPMIAQIDSAGWRFFIPNSSSANGAAAMGQSGSAPGATASPIINGNSGLLPDVYRAQSWYKPVDMAPIQLTLGGEQVAQVLQIPIKQFNAQGSSQSSAQANSQAILIRNSNGRFSWMKP